MQSESIANPHRLCKIGSSLAPICAESSAFKSDIETFVGLKIDSVVSMNRAHRDPVAEVSKLAKEQPSWGVTDGVVGT